MRAHVNKALDDRMIQLRAAESELAALKATRDHMASCRALLNVPGDEVLYEAISALKAKVDGWERIGPVSGQSPADYVTAAQSALDAAASREQVLREALEEARKTLRNIADANWRKWDAPMNTVEDFTAWAKNRASFRASSIDAALSSPPSPLVAELRAEVERLKADAEHFGEYREEVREQIEYWKTKVTVYATEWGDLRAQLAEARKDGERMEWLETVHWGISNHLNDDAERVWMAWDNHDDDTIATSHSTLRAAIDAARKEEA